MITIDELERELKEIMIFNPEGIIGKILYINRALYKPEIFIQIESLDQTSKWHVIIPEIELFNSNIPIQKTIKELCKYNYLMDKSLYKLVRL